VVVLIAGALEFTAWKAHHLACCRKAPGRGRKLPADAGTAWRHGLRLGLHCSYCCVGLTAIHLVIGVMDLRVMAVVAAAITIERLAPAGKRPHAAVTSRLRLPSRTPSQLPPDHVAKLDIVAPQAQARRRHSVGRAHRRSDPVAAVPPGALWRSVRDPRHALLAGAMSVRQPVSERDDFDGLVGYAGLPPRAARF
jgi:hypothetical protein